MFRRTSRAKNKIDSAEDRQLNAAKQIESAAEQVKEDIVTIRGINRAEGVVEDDRQIRVYDPTIGEAPTGMPDADYQRAVGTRALQKLQDTAPGIYDDFVYSAEMTERATEKTQRDAVAGHKVAQQVAARGLRVFMLSRAEERTYGNEWLPPKPPASR